MIIAIMVAGMSSRFGGELKQLAKVGKNGEPLIQVILDQALTAPFKKIIFITNSKTEHHFIYLFGCQYKGIPTQYIRQEWDESIRDRPWGTADAIASLAGKVFESCIFINSDDIYGPQAFNEGYNLMHKTKNNIIGGCVLERTMPDDPDVLANRGVILTDDKNKKVKEMREMLKISRNKNPELMKALASVNFLGLTPNMLFYLRDMVEDFKNINKGDRKIECLLPNMLNKILETRITMNYFVIENEVMGITYPGDEEKVREKLART